MEAKVVLVYKDFQDEIAEETIWTEKLNSGYYRVDNIPFYAANLAYNDIIAVEECEGILYFEDLIESSGHSTVQIIFLMENKANEILSRLESFGCKWEGMKNQPYYSIDIPRIVNYTNIKKVLDEEVKIGVLDYKESCLAENHIKSVM